MKYTGFVQNKTDYTTYLKVQYISMLQYKINL